MRAYYNENDPHAAAWLRELISGGHIAPGLVDDGKFPFLGCCVAVVRDGTVVTIETKE
jgi:hypothetical protein